MRKRAKTQIEKMFRKMFDQLQPVGRFSNGNVVYKRLEVQ